jgi:tRNA pseudouridine synthase 10
MSECMKIDEKLIEVFKDGYTCNNCAGRTLGNLLSGLSNEERGRILRHYIAFLIDSGEKLDVDLSNFYEIKFRNVKIKPEKPKECKICKNFFLKKIDELASEVVKKVKGIDFNTFQVGSIVSDELLKNEEKLLEIVGIEFSETIKSEINRELGKRVEKLTGKVFALRNPDLTIVVDLNTNSIRTQIRSLYFFGKYKKLVRGIPQTKWTCSRCGGKGCTYCKGEGKLYKTSIQEIIEKPLLKATKSKKSSMHASGREDIDARCLGYRPFVIEMVKPLKRKVDLKKVIKNVNKSKKVNVDGLKIITDAKQIIRKLKTEKWDKTYFAEVEFKKPIDKKKLKLLKALTKEPILQKTPLRVVHRRADKYRKRQVKEISYKAVGKNLKLKIKAESGLYIKELINGDSDRTKPSIAEIIDNTPKRINLDVLKIHSKIKV